MSNKQPKQLDETVTTQGSDILVIQKNSSDAVNKVQISNLLPDSIVGTGEIADDAVTANKIGGLPVNDVADRNHIIKTGENVITVGNTITFSTPFPNGINQIVACYGDTPMSTTGALIVDTEATTGFRVRVSGGSGSIRVCWIAIGY